MGQAKKRKGLGLSERTKDHDLRVVVILYNNGINVLGYNRKLLDDIEFDRGELTKAINAELNINNSKSQESLAPILYIVENHCNFSDGSNTAVFMIYQTTAKENDVRSLMFDLKMNINQNQLSKEKRLELTKIAIERCAIYLSSQPEGEYFKLIPDCLLKKAILTRLA